MMTSSSDLGTTLAIAVASDATAAELSTIIEACPDLDLVATMGYADEVLRIAREFVPDVLLIGADLVMAAGATPTIAPARNLRDSAGVGVRLGAPVPRGPVTDLTHPVAVGLRTLCANVSRELPAVRIVVAAPDGVNSYGAVLGGAIGCIAPAEVADCIADMTRRVAWGEGLLTTEWARAVLGDLGHRSTDRKEAGPLGRPDLTPTELDVLRRTAGGTDAAGIAAHHRIPERDVNRSAASALIKARRLHEDQAIVGPQPS
jgi:DNA-binding NarL/FixJ family response regulator